MSKRIKNTKIGDVFSAKIDDSHKKYLQYIISDMTQLNSDVIRAFTKIYPIQANPSLEEIVNDNVDFYAHCVTKNGIKRGLWEKIGNTDDIGRTDHILFRDSGDYGSPEVRISNDWWVWNVNEPFIEVGKLPNQYKTAEIGIVFQPERILNRMKTGSYQIKYPYFE